MTSGQLLREARLRAGLSQGELGERVGRPRTQIARWERDAVAPSFETLREIIRACGFDIAARLIEFDTAYDAELRENLQLTPKERLERALAAMDPSERGRQ